MVDKRLSERLHLGRMGSVNGSGEAFPIIIP